MYTQEGEGINLSITTANEQQATFCPECGQKNDITSKFCESCGTKLFEEQPAVQNTPTPISNMNIKSAKKTAKRIPKKIIIAVGLVASVVILVAALFTVGNAITDPSDIAEKYFFALVDGDYEKAFAYLDIDESEFVNKDGLGKYIVDSCGEFGKLSSYKITDVSQYAGMDDIGSLGQLTAVFAGLFDDEDYDDYYDYLDEIDCYLDDSDKSKRIFLVAYEAEDYLWGDYLYIVLQKNDKKKFLFFDDYDVSHVGYLANDVDISVPAGSTVFLDDIELGGSAGVSVVSEAVDINCRDIDTYTISKMFFGPYKLTVRNALFEDYTKEIKVREYLNYLNVSWDDLTVKESIRNELAKRTENDYIKIFNSAIAGREFSSLGIACTSNQKMAGDIKGEYDKFMKNVMVGDTGGGITDISFKKFESTGKGYVSGDMTYKCSMQVKCDYTMMRNTSFLSETLEEVEYTDRSLSISFTYGYEDNAWVLQNVELGHISYWSLW